MEIEKIAKNLTKLPLPDNYQNWVDVRQEMLVHTRGIEPGEILTKRRPNEDPEVQKYRLENYEPITKGSMNRAIDKLFRIFSSANFSISISEPLDKYLKEKRFKGQYFYSFIQKYVVRRMIEDPNGYLAWLPEGEGLTDPTKKVDVYPYIIDSPQIRHLDSDSITWESEKEFSEVYKGGELVKEGRIYYTLTKTDFYKFKQVGDFSKDIFEMEKIYSHNLGEVPIIVLGGDQTNEDYFESYFSSFLPFGNEAIRQYSDWLGVMTTSCFPYREEQAEECKSPGCRAGWKKPDGGQGEPVRCRACNGTGRVIVRSPYGVYLREKSGNILDPEDKSGTEPMLRFISPDVAIIRESRTAWELLLEKAERALCLDSVKEAQSGIAKNIDREDYFMVMTKISNNVFDEIIFRSLLYIEKYLNIGSQSKIPNIVKPISFSIKTEEDLIDELNKLSDKNAPVSFLVESTKDLAKKRFSGDKSVARLVEILVSYDVIYSVKKEDQAKLLAAGIIGKDLMIKSIYAYKTLIGIVSTQGTEYLENDLEVIFSDLDKAIQPLIDKITSIPVISLTGS